MQGSIFFWTNNVGYCWATKRWDMPITCLVVRAIHIEIAHSLYTSSCIMVLRNFMARCGTSLELISDRGTNFVGANRQLSEAFRILDRNRLMEEFMTPNTKWIFPTTLQL